MYGFSLSYNTIYWTTVQIGNLIMRIMFGPKFPIDSKISVCSGGYHSGGTFKESVRVVRSIWYQESYNNFLYWGFSGDHLCTTHGKMFIYSRNRFNL